MSTSEQRVHRLLVIDGSLSMAAPLGDGTRLDRAKQLAARLVEQQSRPGDRFSLVLLAVALALMGLVLGVGPVVNGSQRWVALAGQQLQPSELMKPAFVVIVSFLFAESMKRRDVPALAIAIALFGSVASLLWLQPDIGQLVLLTAVFAALFFLSGQPVRRLVLLAGLGAFALVVAYGTLPHVKSRFDRFLDPETGDTYQMDRARQSFIEGGWLGRGPGEGTIKSVLPDAHTDYILAVVAEEYGVVACLVLLRKSLPPLQSRFLWVLTTPAKVRSCERSFTTVPVVNATPVTL